MPVILKHEFDKFGQKTDLVNKRKSSDSVNNYKSPFMKTMEVEEGGSIFSSIGQLAKSGINFIGQNKDVIAKTAGAVGSMGTAASSIAKAVESNKKLEQLKKIEEMRNKAEERKQKALSDKTKKELANKLGNGFVRVD